MYISFWNIVYFLSHISFVLDNWDLRFFFLIIVILVEDSQSNVGV